MNDPTSAAVRIPSTFVPSGISTLLPAPDVRSDTAGNVWGAASGDVTHVTALGVQGRRVYARSVWEDLPVLPADRLHFYDVAVNASALQTRGDWTCRCGTSNDMTLTWCRTCLTHEPSAP